MIDKRDHVQLVIGPELQQLHVIGIVIDVGGEVGGIWAVAKALGALLQAL